MQAVVEVLGRVRHQSVEQSDHHLAEHVRVVVGVVGVLAAQRVQVGPERADVVVQHVLLQLGGRRVVRRVVEVGVVSQHRRVGADVVEQGLDPVALGVGGEHQVDLAGRPEHASEGRVAQDHQPNGVAQS
jgi:hypothetical protein